MNRLLQGDVGSGKTTVAAALIYNALQNGYQCALMVPISKSIAMTFFPRFAKPMDIFPTAVDLPTPPLPEATVITIPTKLPFVKFKI